MPTLGTLTRTDLEQVVNAKSLKRANGYLSGIRQPTRTGSTLKAQVRGTRLYEVEVQVNEQGIHALCSCPYDWGGYCKHIAAVLLKWLQAPAEFTEMPPDADSRPADFPLPATPVDPPATYRPQERPGWLTTSFEQRWQDSLEDLAEWLESLKMQELRAIADKRGWSVKGNKKADLIWQLIEQMNNAADTIRALHRLDAEHTRVFLALMLVGSDYALENTDIERVVKHLGKVTKYKQLATYLGHLVEMGLVVPITSDYHGIDFVPDVVLRYCPPLPTDIVPASPDLTTSQPASELRLANPHSFVQQINQLILMLELEQPPLPLRRPMPHPDIAKFYPALKEWDYDPHELATLDPRKLQGYTGHTLAIPPQPPALPDEAIRRLMPVAGSAVKLDFMFNLLVTVGVIQPGSPITIWPEVKEAFFKQDDLRQRAVLARAYFTMTRWSELWDVLRQQPELHMRRSLQYGGLTPEQMRITLSNFRQVALRVLANLPDDQWLRLDDLKPLFRAIWPQFDQTRWLVWARGFARYHGTAGWYLTRRANHAPLSPDSEADWDLAQWNFIRYMLTGPLHWLGLTDILYDNNDQPVEIRLHGLADLFFERQAVVSAPHPAQTRAESTPTPAPVEALRVEGNTITVNPAAVSAQVHSLLDKIARLDEVLPHQFVYTLNPLAAHAAFEEGQSLAGLAADWEQLLPQPLPAHLRQQLEAWWQSYGQVRIYNNVTVIEFSDDYALAEMKAVTSLAEHLLAEISPRLVLIPDSAVASLTAELEKSGYTPKQTNKV